MQATRHQNHGAKKVSGNAGNYMRAGHLRGHREAGRTSAANLDARQESRLGAD